MDTPMTRICGEVRFTSLEPQIETPLHTPPSALQGRGKEFSLTENFKAPFAIR